MAYKFKDRTLRKVGVVGSGNIGPDIALLFTKVLCESGTPVVVVDVVDEALQKGEARTHKKIDKGVEGRAFTPEGAEAMKKNLTFTKDYDQLKGADLIIEAATENKELKGKIFRQLADLCGDECIFASNSSHMEPEVIFEGVPHPERSLVIHYFFPAERNRALEIVPSADTDPQLVRFLMDLYIEFGKTPIPVKSRYGYAIDPIFEGIIQAACLCVEEGLGTVKEVDAAACKAIGLGVGPFTALNLTGGNPITDHGLDVMNEKIAPWFKSPKILKEAAAAGTRWETAKRGEKVDLDPEKLAEISKRLQGAYFGLVTEVLDAGLATLADLEMEVETGLVVGAPFQMMNDTGIGEALSLVQGYAEANPGFPVPQVLKDQAASGKPWEIPVVLREDCDGVAVLTIRRPAVLNALNGEVFDQIRRHAEAIEADPDITAAVITGYGTKAFVSGADIGFLSNIQDAEGAMKTTAESISAVDGVSKMSKPIICAMNGLAFGGGNELAMACTTRIARKGLRVLAGQPEVNLGIIPGAGGTQRLPRLIGVEAAAEMMRTAKPVSSQDALLQGLIIKEVETDLVAEAVTMARQVADGKLEVPPMDKGPMEVPETLPDVDIGHRSTAIDGILCRAILEGCAMPLDEGLAFESKMFGECFNTEDARIGITNFLTKGARSKAEFKHQ